MLVYMAVDYDPVRKLTQLNAIVKISQFNVLYFK